MPSSKLRIEPELSASEPSVSVPGLLPAASAPPLCTVTLLLIVPVPESVPPPPTVTAVLVSFPFTLSVPEATVVAPE